jgi:hypothetical protein
MYTRRTRIPISAAASPSIRTATIARPSHERRSSSQSSPVIASAAVAAMARSSGMRNPPSTAVPGLQDGRMVR